MHALARLGRKSELTYQALIETVRRSPAVAADETGWKVGGRLQWLWTCVSKEVSVFAIQAGRGFEQAATILGEHFGGVLERDGWAPYRSFLKAHHQTCTAHLLRRCRELLQTARGGARHFPLAVQRLLQAGLGLRQQRQQGVLSPTEFDTQLATLEQRTDELLAKNIAHDANRRLRDHLRRERQALFTYLKREGVEATNWRAEQAIRPAVVNRKVWGGNRTWTGAHTQQVLASLLRTCWQQARDPLAIFITLQRAPTAIVAPLRLLASGP